MTAEQVRDIIEDIDSIRTLPVERRTRMEDRGLTKLLEAPYPSVVAQHN